MSQRTLIEINHDYIGKIDENSDLFVAMLLAYLRTGDLQVNLERFGLRIMGRRHHGDAFTCDFGGKVTSEEKS